MSIVEVIHKGSYAAEIYHDECHDSPDDWGNDEIFLGYIDTRHYRMGRADFKVEYGHRHLPWEEVADQPSILEHWGDSDTFSKEKWEEDVFKEGYDVFPVRLLDYGSNGAQLKMCQPCDADGYIWVKNSDTPMSRLSDVLENNGESSHSRAEGLLETWNQYLSGEVYCYAIYRKLREVNEVESDLCWNPKYDRSGIHFKLFRSDRYQLTDQYGGIYGYSYTVEQVHAELEALIQRDGWEDEITGMPEEGGELCMTL